MAIFSNQATLTYNGNSTSSNIAYGEILEVLSATKTAVEGNYRPGGVVTYVITLRNTGTSELTGLTLTDDLGGYTFDNTILYPLTYENDSVLLFANGVPQAAPAVMAGPPLVFSDISVPAGGNVVIVYQARVNSFAAPDTEGTLANTVTVTGRSLTALVTATELISPIAAPELTISKSLSPAQVAENDRVTYTFMIQNSGSSPVVATDDAAITDVFDPTLTDLVVTFEGERWSEGVSYQYNETTGLFTTVPGQIIVPAATFTQDPVTGEYITTPGVVTLTVTGTI